MTMQAGITGWAALLCIAIPYSAHADNGEIRVLMAQQQFADWHMVTVMEGNAPHSLVAFNTAEPQPTEHTIWLRPNEDFSNWDAITWPGAEASIVVTAIKQEVGIPQDFDHLWPVFPADGIGIPIGRPFGERPEEGIINLLDPSHVQNTFPDLDPDWQSTRTELFESPCGYHEALGAITLESRYVSGLYADVAPLVIDDSLALTFCEEEIVGKRPLVELVTLGDAIRTSYDDREYYLLADDVRFTAMASDEEDGALPSSLVLNGEVYIPGTQINETGEYLLVASTTDSDGNTYSDFVTFRIQSYLPVQSFPRVIALESYAEGRDTQFVKATVSIQSTDFDVHEIDVCTLRLLANNRSGDNYRFHVDGSWGEDGVTQTPEYADAGIVNDEFICVFSGIPDSVAIDSFEVIGGGIGLPFSFSFWDNADVVYGIEDPRMDDKNEVVIVDQNVTEPDCGLRDRQSPGTGKNVTARHVIEERIIDTGDHGAIPAQICSAEWKLFIRSNFSKLIYARTNVGEMGYFSGGKATNNTDTHGERISWTYLHCPAGADACPIEIIMKASPSFKIEVTAEVDWFSIGTKAGARAAAFMDIKLVGGAFAGATTTGNAAAYARSSISVIGSMTLQGPDIGITFTPQEKEIVKVDSSPAFVIDSVCNSTAQVSITCGNHIKSTSDGVCNETIIPGTSEARSSSRIFEWHPKYEMIAVNKTLQCILDHEIRPF